MGDFRKTKTLTCGKRNRAISSLRSPATRVNRVRGPIFFRKASMAGAERMKSPSRSGLRTRREDIFFEGETLERLDPIHQPVIPQKDFFNFFSRSEERARRNWFKKPGTLPACFP